MKARNVSLDPLYYDSLIPHYLDKQKIAYIYNLADFPEYTLPIGTQLQPNQIPLGRFILLEITVYSFLRPRAFEIVFEILACVNSYIYIRHSHLAPLLNSQRLSRRH
jgi:hypothetical protein